MRVGISKSPGIPMALCLALTACLLFAVVVPCSVRAADEPNLALTGTASASATWPDPGYEPDRGNDGNQGTRWSGMGSGTEWWQIQWATPQTFNGVVLYNQSSAVTQIIVQVWNETTGTFDDVTSASSLAGKMTLYFPTTTSTTLRLQNIISFWEAEVYRFTDAAVEGHVTLAGKGTPISGATVTVGDVSATTDAAGYYHIAAEPGTYTVTAVKTYQYAEADVTLLGGQVSTLDIELASKNLALLGTAGASSYQESMPPSYSNDENYSTRWEADSADEDQWYSIDWGEDEQTFNRVIVRTYDSPEYYINSLVLEAKNAETSEYETIGTVGDGIFPLDAVVVFDLPATTTSAIRLSKVRSLVDVEVYYTSTVSGTVYDATSGSPIGCASILGGIEPVQSDYDGAYTLQVPVGDCVIRASADPYQDLEQSVTVSDCDFPLDLTMERTPGNLTWLASGASATNPGPDGDAAFAIDGSPCTAYSVPSLNYSGNLVIEWATAQTIDTIKVCHGSAINLGVDVWKDGGWVQVLEPSDTWSEVPIRVEFSPQLTSKIRMRNLLSATEVEVYNLKGSPVAENLNGTVTSARTGKPLAGATISVGDVSTVTGESGRYYLTVPAGLVTVTADRALYNSASQSATAPSTGSVTVDFVLTTDNVAPLATATASEEYTGFGASLGNDDDLSTRFSTKGSADQWYQLEWSSPVTVSRARMHLLSRPMQYMSVDYWDGSSFQSLGCVYTSDSVVELAFDAVTTTKMRFTGIISFYEMEVLNSPISAGPIGQIKDLPDGTVVKATGSVTALFDDAAYLEAFDRSSGIRVEPSTDFIVRGTNVATLGTASASATWPDPGYEADKANDGNTSTRWSGLGTGNEWYQIEWPASRTVNSILVRNAGAPITTIVQVWNSVEGEFDDVTASLMAGWTSTFVSFPDVTTTIVRLQNIISIYELEVFCSESLVDKEVAVTGVLTTVGKERAISATKVTSLGADHPLSPLGLIGRSFSLEDADASTIGLLATTWGRVTYVSAESDGNYLYVDDGSGVSADVAGVTGVRVGPVATSAVGGEPITVTGIAGAETRSDVDVRTLRPRSTLDVSMTPLVWGSNIALQGVASASDTYDAEPGYEAGKGIDGDTATRWSSWGGGANFDVGWSSPQEFNLVVLKNYIPGSTLTVQVRSEATGEFETVASATQSAGTMTIKLPDQFSSAIRLQGVISFWELEIYNAQPAL